MDGDAILAHKHFSGVGYVAESLRDEMVARGIFQAEVRADFR
jgi:hypothetical protein